MAFLPKISGPNNKHEAKVTAMQTRGLIPEDLTDEETMLPDSWAYSDSSADIPLLSIVEHGVMIHPGEKLEKVGLEKGWRAMSPARPYRGKWGNRFAALRQACGLYVVKAS